MKSATGFPVRRRLSLHHIIRCRRIKALDGAALPDRRDFMKWCDENHRGKLPTLPTPKAKDQVGMANNPFRKIVTFQTFRCAPFLFVDGPAGSTGSSAT
jgi:hypothetical protein